MCLLFSNENPKAIGLPSFQLTHSCMQIYTHLDMNTRLFEARISSVVAGCLQVGCVSRWCLPAMIDGGLLAFVGYDSLILYYI